MTTDDFAQDELRSELDDSEQLIWAGRPKRGIVFRGADIFLIPFSLVWCGFVFFAFLALATGHAESNLPGVVITGLLSILGVYILAGRFWFDRWRRKNTFYGIINECVIIRSGRLRRRLKSLNLRTISDITLNEKRGGKGTINLGPQSFWDNWYGGFNWVGAPSLAPAFENIEDAKQVFDILRQAQKES